MPKRFDLEQLPRWLQYTIASVIMAVIATVGYFVGRDQPVPPWIEDFLIPALGVLGLIGIVLIVVDWLRQR
jgi:hypothetical protein